MRADIPSRLRNLEAAPALFGPRLSLLYCAIFFYVGIYLPYFPIWLKSRALNETEIAIILSIPMVVRVLTSGQISAFADRASDRANVLIFLFWGTALASSLFAATQSFWPILAVSFLASLASNPLTPVMDSLTLSGVRRFGADYGRIRLWGSLVFIIANLGGGMVLAGASAQAVLWVMIAAAFSGAFLSFLLPRIGRPRQPAQSPANATRASLFRNRHFVLVIAAAGILQASHAMVYSFGSIYWNAIGHTGLEIGTFWAIGVAAEIVLFQFSASVLRRVSPVQLIALGGLAAVLRWCLMPLPMNAVAYGFLQLLHGLSFGAVHLGTMHYISEAVPETRIGAAQGVGFVLGGVVMGLAMFLCGPIYARFGVDGFLFMAAMAIAALALLLLARNYPQSRGEGGDTSDVE
ncbi:MAG: MFS transporter [Rhizobiaceae bacterium]